MIDSIFRGRIPEPPKLERGTQTVKLIVGPENDQKEFVIHKDLLCATSEFFQRAFSGRFTEGQTQEMRLPEDDPQVFSFFCDWLYEGANAWKGRSFEAAAETWHQDFFWLKLYRMGDRMMLPAVQVLAYSSLADVFDSRTPKIPSRDFVYSLFNEDSPFAMEMYVVEHVAYWLPKTRNKDEWAELFPIHERFGLEMALAMVRSQSRGTAFKHPYDQDRFAEKHDLDLLGLKKEARCADAPASEGAKKELRSVRLRESLRASSIGMLTAK